MPQIVIKSYFNKANGLNIPLAIENPNVPSAIGSPTNATLLDNLCVEIEKKLLLNALGLNLYNQFQLALEDIDNVTNANWKRLLEGHEYDGKIWIGLKHSNSFIANHIYETYISLTNEHLTSVGVSQLNVENSNLVTPSYKIANAHQSFIKSYQGGFLKEPIVFNNVIDWWGQTNELEVSFYQYLRDKQVDFIGLDLNNVKIYSIEETKNSFGL
jgi:hypothetical protein